VVRFLRTPSADVCRKQAEAARAATAAFNLGGTDIPTYFSIDIPGVSSRLYSWPNGLVPQIAGDLATWQTTTNAVVASTSVDAFALGAQNRDDLLILSAGALLGIAGGALVGAIQELID
jgi:hypothetical protein